MRSLWTSQCRNCCKVTNIFVATYGITIKLLLLSFAGNLRVLHDVALLHRANSAGINVCSVTIYKLHIYIVEVAEYCEVDGSGLYYCDVGDPGGVTFFLLNII